MWWLIPAIILAPLLANVLKWRRDLRRLRKLEASRTSISVHDLCRDQAPRVSFLVAAWNEELTLDRCIESILSLSYPSLEVVLCAGGTDRTWEIASRIIDPRLILIAQHPGDGKEMSLKRSLRHAAGEIVYLLDADCLITEDAFAQTLAPVLDGREQAVTSTPCLPLPEQLTVPFIVDQCASRAYTSIWQPEYCSGVLGMNSAIRREALEQAGGFGDVRTGGDYHLGKRLLRQGFRIRYEAVACFPTEFAASLHSYLPQQARWIRSVVVHGIRFCAYREVASALLTSITGLAMLTLPLLAAFLALDPRVPGGIAEIAAAVWVTAFVYAFFSRLRYLKVADLWLGVRLPQRALVLIPIFLLIDFLAWTIPLAEYPFKKLRERW